MPRADASEQWTTRKLRHVELESSKTKWFRKTVHAPRSLLKNQELRGLFREGFWKDAFPMPVGLGALG